MTAEEMRSGVSFQSGLTLRAKLALGAVIIVGIGATASIMMLVNGSWSIGSDKGEDNPFNKSGAAHPGDEANPFSSMDDAFTPGDRPASGASPSKAPTPTAPKTQKQKDDFFKNSPFEE